MDNTMQSYTNESLSRNLIGRRAFIGMAAYHLFPACEDGVNHGIKKHGCCVNKMKRQLSAAEQVALLDGTTLPRGFLKWNAVVRKLMLLVVCGGSLLFTGCYRLAACAFGEGNALFETGSKPYFVTRKMAQENFSGRSYAPMGGIELLFVLIDLPFEAVYETLLLPILGVNAMESSIRTSRMMDNLKTYEYVRYRDMKRFKRRLSSKEQFEPSLLLLCWYEYKMQPQGTLPFIDCLLANDLRYMEAAFEYQSYMYPASLELLRYLFEKGLRIEDVQRDYAVVNAVNNLFDRRWIDNNTVDPIWYLNYLFDSNWKKYSNYERLERQLDLIEFLLEKGCNPNTVSNEHGEWFRVVDERSLAMRTALDQAELFQKSNYRCRLSNEELGKLTDRLLTMLRQHGAKTGEELGLWRDLDNIGLCDTVYNLDWEKFMKRLPQTRRKEKAMTLRWIVIWKKDEKKWSPQKLRPYLDAIINADPACVDEMLNYDHPSSLEDRERMRRVVQQFGR